MNQYYRRQQTVRRIERLDVEQVKRELPKIVLRERLYIPKVLFTPEVRRAFSTIIENYYPEYDPDTGEVNENRDLLVKGWQNAGDDYISLARGDLDKVWEVFANKAEIVDRRAYPHLSFDLRWMGKLMPDGSRSPLKPEQVPFIEGLLEKGYGIGEAPPGFGKTICMSNMTCRLGMKTLVIVHQIELAQQFEAKFRSCTNVGAAEKALGRKLVGICRSKADFDTFDICISTWQQFHAPLPKADAEQWLIDQQMRRRKAGEIAMRKLRDKFGLVIVDETHRAASSCFSSVVTKFNPWYRFGVTATPDRKDQLDAVIKLIVGPVVSVGEEKQILLRVRPVYTGFEAKFMKWYAYESQIMRDARRNKLAVELIEKDVKAGHHVVVVCNRTQHILQLVQALCKHNIRAEGFWSGQKDRKGVLTRAEKGHTQVVVSMRAMLLGIDVPCWSSIHILTPSNNAPNHRQEVSRVRRIIPGKNFAVVRDYLDACSASNGCYTTRHQVYTSAKMQPVVFEDEYGNVMKKISLAYIKSRAVQPRSSTKGATSLEEADRSFGAGGPKLPNFSTWEGFGQ
jgi:superfamily II DNA or RNA helicase